MSTTLKLTSCFGTGALAFWLSAAAVSTCWHDIGLITLLVPMALAAMSTLMYAEASVTWSYARRQFDVSPKTALMVFGLGAASSAATLAVGAGLNLGWAWLVPSVTILPALIVTAVLWYLSVAFCVVTTHERVRSLQTDQAGREGQSDDHGTLHQAG